MKKYLIEDNVNFYKQLLLEEDEEDCEKEDICLITKQPLVDKYVTMDCGHKFNYIPLFNDLVNHKKKFNKMESSERLGTKQLRCPYCRKKQNKLLTFYEELGLQKVAGVNYMIEQQSNLCVNIKCQYKFPNEQFDPTQPESMDNPKFHPHLTCPSSTTMSNKTFLQTSNVNANLIIQQLLNADNSFYCWKHMQCVVKETIAIGIKQAKEAEKQAKQLKKQYDKEEKAKEKAAKEEAKAAKKQLTCQAVLKFGANKGNLCGCAVKEDNLCWRHLKVINSDNTNM